MAGRLLITVHGIRTFGQWQERLGRLCAHQDASILVEHFKYGYFSVFAFLIPVFRSLVVRTLRNSLTRALDRWPDRRVTLVGHSNGTYLIAHCLRTLDPKYHSRFDRIILAGSVLKSDFDWTMVCDRLGIEQVVNDCGDSDGILLLSQFFVLFTGMAGRVGFYGLTGGRVVNRYFTGGHSHYFESAGVATDVFMQTHWVPAILYGQVLPHDERHALHPVGGVVLWLMQNADSLKASAYSLVVFVLVNEVYLEPRRIIQQERTTRIVSAASRSFEEERNEDMALQSLTAFAAQGGGEEFKRNTSEALRYYFPRFHDFGKEIPPNSVLRAVTRLSTRYFVNLASGLHELWAGDHSHKFLLKNSMLLDLHSTGRIRVFRPDDYMTSVTDKHLSEGEWRRYRGETVKERGEHLGDQLKIDPFELEILSAFALPLQPEGVLRIVVTFEAHDPTLAGKGFSMRSGRVALLTYSLQTDKWIFVLLPELPLISADCSLMVATPSTDLRNRLLEMAQEQRSVGRRKGLTATRKEIQAPDRWPAVLATTSGPSLVLSEASRPRAEAINSRWKGLNVKDGLTCPDASSERSIDAKHGDGKAMDYRFPQMMDEVDLWARVEDVPKPEESGPLAALSEEERAELAKQLKKLDRKGPLKSESGGHSDPSIVRTVIVNALSRTDEFTARTWLNSNGIRVIVVVGAGLGGEAPVYVAHMDADKRSLKGRSFLAHTNKRQGPFFSKSTRYLAFKNAELRISESAVIVDLETLENLQVEQTPSGETIAMSFSPDEREITLLGKSSELVVYALPSGKVLKQLDASFATLVDDLAGSGGYKTGYPSLLYHGDSWIVFTPRSNVLSIRREDGVLVWRARWNGEEPGVHQWFVQIGSDGVGFFRDATRGRLISLNSGYWLSGVIQANSLVHSGGAECGSRIGSELAESRLDDAVVTKDGHLAVAAGNCWFQRAPALSPAELQAARPRLQNIIGPELEPYRTDDAKRRGRQTSKGTTRATRNPERMRPLEPGPHRPPS